MKKYKDETICHCEGCQNLKMESSDVCIECYQRISNDMAKTVKCGDNKPFKVTDRTAFIKMTELVNNTEGVQ